jgi:phage-related protein
MYGYIDNELFKKLENSNIWEFRTLYNGISYRLFSFWDTNKNSLVIATHGIIKKTQKTPKKEIDKAENIRREYFNNQLN